MKMQPLFTFQKYEKDKEDAIQQFQKQLSDAYIQGSNAVNATIDDISYFLAERPTGEAWTDKKQIYNKTVVVTLPNAGTTTTAHGITNIGTVIDYRGRAQPATWSGAGSSIVLPYVDSALKANDIQVDVTATSIRIISGANYSTYSGSVTIWYTKTT